LRIASRPRKFTKSRAIWRLRASSSVPAGTPINFGKALSKRAPGSTDYLRIVLKMLPRLTRTGPVAKLIRNLNAVRDRKTFDAGPPTQDGDLLHFKLRHAGVPVLEMKL